jgi:hypothetical protein
MRSVLVFIVATSFLLKTNAQTANEFQRSSPRMLAFKNLPGDDKVETVQSNFLSQTWRPGTVYFKNSANKMDVPLMFDVYNNQLYFLKDSMVMEFIQPVREFFIAVVEKTDTVDVHFRNGYPPIHRNTDDTFYEVLVDGKFQLLKCKAKTIALYKDKDVPEEDRDYAKQLLYAVGPDSKIVLVKADKDYMLKTLPDYAGAIQKICSDQKLKLKNESQLHDLFLALNQ